MSLESRKAALRRSSSAPGLGRSRGRAPSPAKVACQRRRLARATTTSPSSRALDTCDALEDVAAFVEERKQARDRVDGACVRNALRLCQPETSQVGRALGSVFVPRSPVDDVLASPSAVADASTAAVADDVRYVQLPVRAGAGAVASAAACAALLDEASMCTV